MGLFQIIAYLSGSQDPVSKALGYVVVAIGEYFTNLWDNIVTYYNKFTAWLWDKTVYCAESIHWFFLDEEKGLIWEIISALVKLIDWFKDKLPSVEDTLGEYSTPFTVTMELVGKADLFFPITEAVTLLFVFVAFVAIFLMVKAVLKMLPWIG